MRRSLCDDHVVFTIGVRDQVRDRLIDRAKTDARVVGCALVGSAARDQDDAWSDIDLALKLDKDAGLRAVADDWTAWLTQSIPVADTLDVHAFRALYRVFFCTNSLQIDLSFWPNESFRATGEPMRLIFGAANPADQPRQHDPHGFIQMGWLYALHARSAIARDRTVQADRMLADLRNQVIALACIRLGLSPEHGRDAHLLPQEVTDALKDARAIDLRPDELHRSLRANAALYLTETAHHSNQLAAALGPAIGSLLVPLQPTHDQ